ncbi:MAG TPA: glutamine-hydrolyzing GMP synthase [Spirochaetes bacterium]|nr:glutamine-hydrolyzing GMP synthase [Spirochaetota bacterium]
MTSEKRERIAILDFGSQYTQLIARKVRELKVYCEILPYNISLTKLKEKNVRGIILSGGPKSIYEEKALKGSTDLLKGDIPLLGICYGMQWLVHELGGQVEHLERREYGKTQLYVDEDKGILEGFQDGSTVWMSHGDTVTALPEGFTCLGHTDDTYGAIQKDNIMGVQFHPEVAHTEQGKTLLSNFLFKIAKLEGDWTMKSFVDQSIAEIKGKVGNKKVICALSGGVDSSVTAVLLQKAMGDQLTCIFVNNGLLRMKEEENVKSLFKEHFKINLNVVKAEDRFLEKLAGVTDPEKKRKLIGHEFIAIFEEEAHRLGHVDFLAQGTLYPDIIESQSLTNPSAMIKSHHNVGGLPEAMKLDLIEPLKELFKDEVRVLGKELGLSDQMVYRHPFPGPGLAIRILGEVTHERLEILRLADAIAIEEIINANLYSEIWQAFVVLLPVKTVGVMGDDRTYENVAALRCVNSSDGMTADWYPFPYDTLARIANRMINEVKGVNRVVYDVTSKPPGTIEWE